MTYAFVSGAPPPLPPIDGRRRHLIYSFFVECTGLFEIFRAVFDSYLKDDILLRLTRDSNGPLIEAIKETINEVYARPRSAIAPDPEQLRLNAYWRLFGLRVPGKVGLEETPNYNAEFEKTFGEAMIEIFQGILDQGVTGQPQYGNPSAVAEHLNNLRQQLVNRTFNEIRDISEASALHVTRLFSLLDNDEFMGALNIRSKGRPQRLKDLADKVKPKSDPATQYLLILAERIEVFLRRVEDTDWNTINAGQLFLERPFFSEISTAWGAARKRHFRDEASARRRPTT